MADKDPYKYFRIEAREIVERMGRGVLQLEKEKEPGADLVGSLLRLAHTLKGAARVVKQAAIAERAHAIEDALAPLRTPGARLGAADIDRALKLLDEVGVYLTAIDAPPTATAPVAAPTPASSAARPPAILDEVPAQTVRADLAEMDLLLEGVSEAAVQLRALRPVAGTAEHARSLAGLLLDQLGPERTAPDARRPTATAGTNVKARALAAELATLLDDLAQDIATGVDQADRQLQEVRGAAERLRLLPVGGLFSALERAARDDAHALGKTIAFEASGGELRVDAHVFGTIQGALVQMVRNAVAHGIESPSERTSAGKPAAGQLSVEVVRQGNRVRFACRDDGRGIDLRAVREAARQRGLLPPSQAGDDEPDADALLALLLRGGLTTTRAVTELSGRGIGLDIVREAAARLGGEVTAHTQLGRETTLRLTVPVQVSSLDALMVEADGVTAAIPLDGVRGALRLVKGQVARAADGDSIIHDGQVIPFVRLALAGAARTQPAARQSDEIQNAVVVDGNTARAAIGVDRLLGITNVVVRPLPRLAPADGWIAGAALDREGTPQLVIDPDGLVRLARSAPRVAAPAEEAPAAVLVIDDSLTTRMLEQSILESAGYVVELATSAEEGLDKARLRTYDLFLVDVEMPGMDGFTFVERTRADTVLRATPAILVTSRNAPEDRRRGAEAGASAYIVKGDFDQSLLLETIRKLVGR